MFTGSAMKTTRLLLVILAAIAAFAFLVLNPPPGLRQQDNQAPTAHSRKGTQAPSSNLDAVMPDGATLTFSQFESQAGPQLAALLKPLNVNTITRQGDQFILDCTPGTLATSSVSATIASTVKARVEISDNGATMKMSDIEGVTVDLGILGSKKELREIEIVPIDATTAQVNGKLRLAKFLPLFPFSVTIDMTQVH